MKKFLLGSILLAGVIMTLPALGHDYGYGYSYGVTVYSQGYCQPPVAVYAPVHTPVYSYPVYSYPVYTPPVVVRPYGYYHGGFYYGPPRIRHHVAFPW